MGSNLDRVDFTGRVEVELSYYNLSTFLSDYIESHGLQTAVRDISCRLHISILDLERKETERKEKENEIETEL